MTRHMEQPNILLLMTDQLRADHLGWSESPHITTPNLDRIADGGCVFDKARTVNPVCQPARTALLTGRYSRQIHTLAMGKNDLPSSVPTYCRALREAGYRTIGIGKFHFLHGTESGPNELEHVREYHKALGFEETWEASGKELPRKHYCDWSVQLEKKGILNHYLENMSRLKNHAYNWSYPLDQQWVPGDWPFDEEDYVDCATGTRIVDTLRQQKTGKPFFLFGSFCGPHPPYDPPRRFLDQFPLDESEPIISARELTATERRCIYELRRRYKAMIALIDEQVGRILDALDAEGMADNTIIAFTSDHGEFLGDHATYDKMRPQAPSVNIPLAIKLPAASSIRHEGLVELTDLTATLLDAAGLDPQESLSGQNAAPFHDRIPGRSLLPIVRGETTAPIREDVFSEFAGVWSSIETERWKYIRYQQGPEIGQELLFDLKRDPEELQNCADDPGNSEALQALRNRLLAKLDWAVPGQFGWHERSFR